MVSKLWPRSPLVKLENHHPHGTVVSWRGTDTLPAELGEKARFSIRMVSLGYEHRTWFKYLVETVDLHSNDTDTIADAEVVAADRTDVIEIPLNAQVQRIRVTVWNFANYRDGKNPPNGSDNRVWHEPETRYFTCRSQVPLEQSVPLRPASAFRKEGSYNLNQ
jgi:hypothetical protein